MATAFVNKHTTRVLAAGGTVAEPTWLGSVDTWITGQSLYGNLFEWANPAFGVIKNGSNEISKIMGLGTTWLPRLGDMTPAVPTSTIYNATANSSKPAWVSTSSAYSYWGVARSGTIRAQQIRRKHHQGLTVVCVYKKTHAFQFAPLGQGQFGSNFALVNTAGSPGSCKAWIGGTTFTATHATTVANNAVNIIGLTFDGDTLTTYVEGAAGAQATGYVATYTDSNKTQYRPLLGAANNVNQTYYALVSGSSESVYSLSSSSTSVSFGGIKSEADASISDLIIFDTALTPTQMASLNTLLRTRY